jgi:hypothetical protein
VVLNHGVADARAGLGPALATGGTTVHAPALGEPVRF